MALFTQPCSHWRTNNPECALLYMLMCVFTEYANLNKPSNKTMVQTIVPTTVQYSLPNNLCYNHKIAKIILNYNNKSCMVRATQPSIIINAIWNVS